MFGVFMLVMLLIGIALLALGSIVLFAARKSNADVDGFIPVAIVGLVLVIITGIPFGIMNFKVIDAGEVGVQTKFGKVLDQNLTEGFNKKSPFVAIHEYNIRINEYTMSGILGEGAKDEGDSIQARTKDDLQVSVDLTIRWSVDPISAGIIYRTISPKMRGIVDVVVRPSSRSLTRDVVAQYNLNELNQKRPEVSGKIFGPLAAEFVKKGLILDSVLIRDVHPPDSIDRAIQSKLAKEQELQEQEYKVKIAEQNAEIRRIDAAGIADAQKIIQADLTPIYVQYEAIQAYKELAMSDNTTFVIMPTSTEGAGMPLIIGN